MLDNRLLLRADEGHTTTHTLGRPPRYPPPKVPEGFRNPAQSAPEPMPWAGFSLGRRRPANLERPTLCRRPWAESAAVAAVASRAVQGAYRRYPSTTAPSRSEGRASPRSLGKDRLAELDEWAYGLAKEFAAQKDDKGKAY